MEICLLNILKIALNSLKQHGNLSVKCSLILKMLNNKFNDKTATVLTDVTINYCGHYICCNSPFISTSQHIVTTV